MSLVDGYRNPLTLWKWVPPVERFYRTATGANGNTCRDLSKAQTALYGMDLKLKNEEVGPPHSLNFSLANEQRIVYNQVKGYWILCCPTTPYGNLINTITRYYNRVSYPLLAVEDSFFLSIYGCCDYLCKSKRQIPLREALRFLTYS